MQITSENNELFQRHMEAEFMHMNEGQFICSAPSVGTPESGKTTYLYLLIFIYSSLVDQIL